MDTPELKPLVDRCVDPSTGVRRASEWDGRHKTGFALFLEHPGRQVVARLQLEPITQMFNLQALRYHRRPGPGADPFYGDAVAAGPVQLHAGDWLDGADLEQKVSAMVGHFCRSHALLAWNGAPSSDDYLRAFKASELERQRVRDRLPDLLWLCLKQMDRLSPKAIVLPEGWSFHGNQEPGGGTAHGLAPAHFHLSVDHANQPSTPNFPPMLPYGCLVSPFELTELVAAWITDGARHAESDGSWELIPAGTSYLGDRRPQLSLMPNCQLAPSKEFVQILQRISPRNQAFADFIEPLDEGAWRSVYDGTATKVDAGALLEARVRAAPTDFAAYRAVAEHHQAAGRAAQANLWLGLGYLRAHGSQFLAKAKLEAAQRADPTLPGLTEALAELARPRG